MRRVMPRGLDCTGLVVSIVAVLTLAVSGCVRQPAAPAFPAKPLTSVVWSGAGGVADTTARTLAPLLEKELGQPVVVENKAGGGGAAGVNYMLAQPGDGYTFMTVTPTLASMFSESGITFKPDDFQPIVLINLQPYIMIVPASSPLKTFDEFLGFARANPGKLKIAGPFATGGHRVHWEKLAEAANISATWVPFDGSGEADLAVLGGQVDAGSTNNLANVSRQVQAGKLRVLVVTTEKRLEDLADVPTAKERGINFSFFNWSASVTKKGVPQAALDKLVDAHKKAMQTQEWKAYLKNQGMLDGSAMSPDEIRALIDREKRDAEELKKKLGL